MLLGDDPSGFVAGSCGSGSGAENGRRREGPQYRRYIYRPSACFLRPSNLPCSERHCDNSRVRRCNRYRLLFVVRHKAMRLGHKARASLSREQSGSVDARTDRASIGELSPTEAWATLPLTSERRRPRSNKASGEREVSGERPSDGRRWSTCHSTATGYPPGILLYRRPLGPRAGVAGLILQRPISSLGGEHSLQSFHLSGAWRPGMSNRSVFLVCSSDVERSQRSNDSTCVEAMIARVKSANRVVWFCICRSSHVHPLPLLQGSDGCGVRRTARQCPYLTTQPK